MDHRATSIQFLRQTGLIPVKVRPRQKEPFPDWDPRAAALKGDHSATLAALEERKELNIGALFHGKYVDIDIDTDQPFLLQALDYFLPKTPYVWGRASKPRSHRAYVLHDDFDRDVFGPICRFLKSLRIDGQNYSIEVRGGKPENGLFTVLPGSYREDADEWVEWAPGMDTSVSAAHISVMQLMKSVRMAVATSLICQYFGDGVRNDLSLAVSGVLWRIRQGSMVALGLDNEDEAMLEDYFFLTEDDATAIFEAVLHLADPNTGDRRARTLNFSNTWRKLDSDPTAKVTGGKVMAELIGSDTGPKVVQALYRLLSDNTGIEALEKLADKFVIWYGMGVLVDLDMVRHGRNIAWMTKEQAANSLGNQRVTLAEKKIPLVNLLFSSPAIPRVAGLTFDPSSNDIIVDTEEGPMVNQWKGFGIEACPQRVSDEEVAPFLQYMFEVVANGDQKMYEWVLAWCADLFQDPANKPGTTLVLVGPQGSGKTFLGERVLGKIIGKSHYVQLNSISQLTDKFNTICDNKVFVQCDEAIHSYQKDVASRLKSLITDETMTIEPKGINSYRKPNHMRLYFTSNEESNPIFIDPSPHERRFTVQKISSKYATDLEYWTHLRAWTEMNLHKILRWFLDYRYDKRLVNRPLTTKAKQDIQRMGVDPEVAWILNRVANGFPIAEKSHEHWWHAFNTEAITETDKANDTLRRDVWPNRIRVESMEADFREFVRGQGRTVYSGSIITSLRKVLPDQSLDHGGQITVSHVDQRTGRTVKSRVRIHSFPSQEEILDHLRDKYGAIVDKLFEEALKNDLPEESASSSIETEEY